MRIHVGSHLLRQSQQVENRIHTKATVEVGRKPGFHGLPLLLLLRSQDEAGRCLEA